MKQWHRVDTDSFYPRWVYHDPEQNDPTYDFALLRVMKLRDSGRWFARCGSSDGADEGTEMTLDVAEDAEMEEVFKHAMAFAVARRLEI